MLSPPTFYFKMVTLLPQLKGCIFYPLFERKNPPFNSGKKLLLIRIPSSVMKVSPFGFLRLILLQNPFIIKLCSSSKKYTRFHFDTF
eukprot:UN12280